jgi:dienelactone hydrolase
MPGLPPALIDIPVETVKHAIDALLSRPDVNGRLGALGISKGGELVLLASSTYSQINATIAIVPAPFAYMGLNAQDIPTACSWTLGGKELPCIPADSDANSGVMQEAMTGKPLILTPLYDASWKKDPAVTAKATFPLENIRGPVLCLGGKDDAMWDSSAHCDIAMHYLTSHHHAYPDREINYRKAGHTFIIATNGPKSAMISYSWPGGSMAFGGTAQGDADAATSAWKSIWSFLKTSLGS